MPVVTEDELEEIREEASEEWVVEDILMETVRDKFQLENRVEAIIEGELLHPQGVGTIQDVEDLAYSSVEEWVNQELPDSINTSTRDKIHNTLYDKLSKKSVDKYHEALERLSTDEFYDFEKRRKNVENQNLTREEVNEIIDELLD